MKCRKLAVLLIMILLSAVVIGCSDDKQDTKMAENSSSIATVLAEPLPESGAEVVFSKPKLPGYLSVSGLSFAESWGRWSDGDKVILKFGSKLPAKFSLTIAAIAYGPNAGEAVIVKAGNQTKEYKFVADVTKSVTSDFLPSAIVDTIEILIPKPTPPPSRDTRRLGLGFSSLKLIEIPESDQTVPTEPLPESGAEVVFSKPKLPGYLSVSGLSFAESWGRWSDGDKVILKFGSKLPAKFSLTIAAIAYGPNAGEAVIVKAGNQTKEYKFVADVAKTQSEEFSPSVTVDTIEILIPKPTTSPGDIRRLGLAFSGLSLIAIP